MNIFNKYEAFGILASVAVMILVLGIVRFKSDSLLSGAEAPEQQAAVVVAESELDNTAGRDDVSASEDNTGNNSVEQSLREAFTADGTLVNLVVDDVKIGGGRIVKDGDTVNVHYIGTLQDGTRFDSSYDRGTPFSFTVGNGQVIQGWEKGLIGMKEGGERILVIPSEMAYGNRKVGPIPPNSPLVFSIELLSIE